MVFSHKSGVSPYSLSNGSSPMRRTMRLFAGCIKHYALAARCLLELVPIRQTYVSSGNSVTTSSNRRPGASCGRRSTRATLRLRR